MFEYRELSIRLNGSGILKLYAPDPSIFQEIHGLVDFLALGSGSACFKKCWSKSWGPKSIQYPKHWVKQVQIQVKSYIFCLYLLLNKFKNCPLKNLSLKTLLLFKKISQILRKKEHVEIVYFLYLMRVDISLAITIEIYTTICQQVTIRCAAYFLYLILPELKEYSGRRDSGLLHRITF